MEWGHVEMKFFLFLAETFDVGSLPPDHIGKLSSTRVEIVPLGQFIQPRSPPLFSASFRHFFSPTTALWLLGVGVMNDFGSTA